MPINDNQWDQRRPGDLFRAMATLYLRTCRKQSRESLARKLQKKLDELEISYHPRTLKRQLTGAVASVPQQVEDAMRALLVDASALASNDDVEAALREAGLDVPKRSRLPTRVPVRRLMPMVELWLHYNPGQTKRALAHRLVESLGRKGIDVGADGLQAKLAGRGRWVRREVLREVVGFLAKFELASESAALERHQELSLEIEMGLDGRRLTRTDRFRSLVDVWAMAQHNASRRALAKRLKERLGEQGINYSLHHLQELCNGHKDTVPRRLLDTLEAVVTEGLPAGKTLADAVADAENNERAWADLQWVDSSPIVARARAWLLENPKTSQRQLAIAIAEAATELGFRTTHNTVQPILSGARGRTHGYIYRATIAQTGGSLEAEIPEEHVLRSKRGEEKPRRLKRTKTPQRWKEAEAFLAEARKQIASSPSAQLASLAARRAERLFGIPQAEAKDLLLAEG